MHYIEKYADLDDSILEIGAGTGRYSHALDLSAFPDEQYDITLLLGPMYHLYEQEDKRQELREAIRVSKPGGVVFVAYEISDGCLLDEGFLRKNINVKEYIEKGLIDGQTFFAASEPKDLFELVCRGTIDTMDEEADCLNYDEK